jgi:uncharacterized membrane protein
MAIKQAFKKLASVPEATEALKERGTKQLLRLSIIIDVLFAIMIFNLFMFLPRPELDNFDATNMLQVFKESYVNYLVMVVGIILILIYWNQSNLQFGNLERTDGRHSTISILQVISLMIYLYFVRLDTQLGATTFILQMESVMLALAGFFSIYSWHYSIRNNLISDNVTKLDQDKVYLTLIPEPIVSVLSFPFAWLGPGWWTASWLLLIPVSWALKRYRDRLTFLASSEDTKE